MQQVQSFHQTARWRLEFVQAVQTAVLGIAGHADALQRQGRFRWPWQTALAHQNGAAGFLPARIKAGRTGQGPAAAVAYRQIGRIAGQLQQLQVEEQGIAKEAALAGHGIHSPDQELEDPGIGVLFTFPRFEIRPLRTSC